MVCPGSRPLRGEAEAASAHECASVFHGTVPDEAHALYQERGLVGVHLQELALPGGGHERADGLVTARESHDFDSLRLVV